MSGGGAHNPAQPPPPSDPNGGEYLLRLLQSRNQTLTPLHQPPPPQQPPQQPELQPLPVDPAILFAPWNQANGQDLTNTPWLNPNLYSHGFSQNPWSSPSFPQDPNSQFRLNPQFEDVRKMGFSGTEIRDPTVNNVNSVFGGPRRGYELNSVNHYRAFVGLENGFQNSVDSMKNRQSDSRVNMNSRSSSSSNPIWRTSNANYQGQKWGNPQRGEQYRSAQPGFSNKPSNGMNWDSGNKIRIQEHNVGNERDRYSSDFRLNGGDDNVRRLSHGRSKTPLSDQIDNSGPRSGSELHSVSALDVEESVMDSHKAGEERESRLRGDRDSVYKQGRDEFDELSEEIASSLVLRDGSAYQNDERKPPRIRDRDIRSDTRGRQILGQRMRNFKSHTECRGDINQLNASFVAIYESLIPSDEEKEKQKQLLTYLENLVTKEWPKARLHLYGSCANSFGLLKSDIDVCLATEDANVNKAEVLLRLADILQADNLENVQALVHARVPIVKLLDPATGISCDICINNVLAVVNTKLLRDYAQLDIRLQQLAFIIKHWAKSRGVNATYQGTLSSYAYVLMCIHFLQQRRPAILPCLQGMETTYSVSIEGVQCAFFDKVERVRDFGSRNKESIAQLLWAFFSYWAYCHDYTNSVISVRTGTLISKRTKDWTRRIGNDRHLICIEDPFETSHDLGRVVDKYSIKVLREEFERAAEIMQYDPNPCVTLFQPYIPN